MNADEQYSLGVVVGVVTGLVVPLIWMVGYAEWYLTYKHGGETKERYDNTFIAGCMRGYELWAKVLTICFVVLVVLTMLGVML